MTHWFIQNAEPTAMQYYNWQNGKWHTEYSNHPSRHLLVQSQHYVKCNES